MTTTMLRRGRAEVAEEKEELEVRHDAETASRSRMFYTVRGCIRPRVRDK